MDSEQHAPNESSTPGADTEAPPAIDAAAPPPAAAVAVASAGRKWTAPAIVLYAAVVLLAWVALELWGLGAAPFHTKGEPREALVVWEMTHQGGWILPQRNGTELPSKPPLFHWLGAATSLVHGATDEWSIRFPSAALSLASLLCVFAAGCALWNPRAGLFSALVLMTTFEWARAATNARVDMTLTFGLQLAFLGLLFFLRRGTAGWLVPMYLGITFAVLGKGPVGVALPGLVALAMVALAWDITPLRRMRLLTGSVVVAVGAGTWYVLALCIGGYGFFRKQILGENLFTFVDDPDFHYGGHRHGWWYMLGALLLGVLPWTVHLPGVAVRLWRERRTITRDDARVYLLVWSAIVFAFYTVAASKRSVYLLALYPAVALLLGWWWDAQSRAPQEDSPWIARLVRVVGWILLGVVVPLLVLVLLEALGAPLAVGMAKWLPAGARGAGTLVSTVIRGDRWPLLGLLAAAAGALYGMIRAARTSRWLGMFAGLWSTTALLLVAVRLIILPAVAQHLTVRDFMADVRRVVGADGNVSFYRTFDYEAVFYWGGHIPAFDGAFPDASPQYLLVNRNDWPQLRATAQDAYEAVALPADPQRLDELMLLRRRGPQ
jgi:4-amino-4-deoxy-L-arabinose transferase-like glycosyltransferase